jgi:hypothetical protein
MNWCTHISSWPSLHSTSPHLRTLHILATDYFTSLYFWMIFATHSLRLIYHLPNPFPKITWFTGESRKHLQVIGCRAGLSYLQRNIFHGVPLRWPRDTLYPQKLALYLPASGGRSVGIIRLRTKATEFRFSFFSFYLLLSSPNFPIMIDPAQITRSL